MCNIAFIDNIVNIVHLKDIGNAKQRFLRLLVCDHLKKYKIMFRRQMTQISIDQFLSNLNLTCRIVKFSRTLFIMYFSGRFLSFLMKLTMYSHMGLRSSL